MGHPVEFFDDRREESIWRTVAGCASTLHIDGEVVLEPTLSARSRDLQLGLGLPSPSHQLAIRAPITTTVERQQTRPRPLQLLQPPLGIDLRGIPRGRDAQLHDRDQAREPVRFVEPLVGEVVRCRAVREELVDVLGLEVPSRESERARG